MILEKFSDDELIDELIVSLLLYVATMSPSPSRKGDMSYYSSSRSSSRATDCKVYVGDLGNGAAKGELERAFSYYGPLRTVWVARNPPGFAFVEFEDPRDAEDAVKGMDGK